ncbi:hypothetical protein [Kineosporia succinea]|uniref:Uncharacterized protein n=1 Tax=Kineosporia succinea TaxID=84632 RepID=A0ABT9PC95_9ACTN|nr:hypothetical protein [Kineosporia succinea]MDP9830329.1 hypothetical protein [Kineosporia succinea]
MIDLHGYLRKLQRPPVTGRPERATDAAGTRALLGNYQRALASARQVLSAAHPGAGFQPVRTSLFTTNNDGGADRGSSTTTRGDQ